MFESEILCGKRTGGETEFLCLIFFMPLFAAFVSPIEERVVEEYMANQN